MHPIVLSVTERIRVRSAQTRRGYLAQIEHDRRQPPMRAGMSCTNLAHAYAAAPANDKFVLRAESQPNIAIVSAYNDMLSAHQPLAHFPDIIKVAARQAGATAQFAGGVPAMCDGVTQGAPGMELSLFSRDVIAMATAIALSHNVFDAVLCLGVCDKIVPGLVIGALKFGHLPTILVPAGPMTSGLANDDKAKIRQLYALGKVDRAALLEAESQAYHGAGTCTFYGTANSNQMLMEVMGLHLPGTAFVNPGTPLREALTAESARQVLKLTVQQGEGYTPIGHVVDERAIVNGIVGLHATGGSTNHTIHLVAMARAAGIVINWDDFHDLSAVVPLLARIYPNGSADVNHFHAAGGMGFLMRELLDAGLLHRDVRTVMGQGLDPYTCEPKLLEICVSKPPDTREPQSPQNKLTWQQSPVQSGDETVLRPAVRAFSDDGGLKLMAGNLGRAVLKVSAVKPAHRVVEAPAIVFDSQQEMLDAFKRGELQRDFVAVVRFQGPQANGMPELHKLTPCLGILQDAGFKVALVTDGRMSGASGKVPAAIHVSPEALAGGAIGRVRTGDMICVNGEEGSLEVRVDATTWAKRDIPTPDLSHNQVGLGRDLFSAFRRQACTAEEGGSPII
jgi:phosphogluconate dehydratase